MAFDVENRSDYAVAVVGAATDLSGLLHCGLPMFGDDFPDERRK